MLGAIASAALLVGAALIVGRAALALCGRAESLWLSAPAGFALLLVLAGIVAGWGGRGTAIAVALGVLLVASAAVVARRGLAATSPIALLAAALAALVAAIPFIAAGQVGILGVGLVNDDMASHLLLADWIDERFRPEPALIDQGYPLGPHALVAGLAEVLHARTIDVFAGLTLAIPALTALVAFAALDGLRRGWRIAAAALVALPYMATAYLAQEAFKEPTIALLLLGFALVIPAAQSPRQAIPLGILAAGAVYVYSFPGLAWFAGTVIAWLVLTGLRARRANSKARILWPAVAAMAATAFVLALPDVGRLLDFIDFRALHPDRANEGGLGNLPGQLSPLQAFGIWPTGEFRLAAGASDLPAAVFYAGGIVAVCAFGIAGPRWIRRFGYAVPAALATAALLYVAARLFGTVYTSAKALAIAAPLIALMSFGGLWASGRRLAALGALVAVAAAFSSLLVLRQAPVGPEAHAEELAEIRPLVEGEKLLFLGRDNFVLWELRGSRPFVSVRNFYLPSSLYVEPNTELEDVFSKFDFDSVTGETLARFPYVLTTRAGYASSAPPAYEVVERTDSYELWRRGPVSPAGRTPGEDDSAPGRMGGCAGEPARVTAFSRAPVVSSDWSPATIGGDDLAGVSLDLPRGRWELSLRYDSTRPVTLSAPGLERTLPGNLDYRGAAPYWAAGTVESAGGPVEITATVERPPLAGRLLGADSVAHLGTIAATEAGGPGSGSCRDYVDWYSAKQR